ncbi:phage tail P2-like protein [Rhodothalassium salexigens DSM 2132]|uniref:Phage tail P2-like protein n=1 Tax=Rhodothalassium salexigens DSM 2132 TaxID=1188247 RepID=A0A4R2P790_RHOSA|nr:phage tail protein I [Rhodothalassium salexigens]MBB4212764.1 phage tail P2-like protein [Rhodothalassium salexigens DSM 2132]MBK1638967.1 phage tail protein I [Rhodothalassium salexigens DSM 2132]TCP30044.1 phage tail P2-like protein [Rhodothalassium salexigens DSM 2132]
MTELLPAASTDLERAADRALARLDRVPVPIGDLWRPETCPAEALPFLAWALSVDELWDYAAGEAERRALTAASVDLHARKGTPAAVRQAVETVFGAGEVLEPWDTGGPAHTFKVRVSARLDGAETLRRLLGLVDAMKPARSHLVAVQIDRRATARRWLGLAAHTGTRLAIRPRLDPAPRPARLGVAALARTGTRLTLRPATLAPAVAPAALHAGGRVRTAHRLTIGRPANG